MENKNVLRSDQIHYALQLLNCLYFGGNSVWIYGIWWWFPSTIYPLIIKNNIGILNYVVYVA